MKDEKTTISNLREAVREFVHERDWEKFHNPKDIAESICIEAAELLQLFQWITPKQSQKFGTNPGKMKQIQEELADVLLYSLSMANALNIDLTATVLQKIRQNKRKYPKDKYKGKAHLILQ